jgi:hypothetical protein
LAFAKYKNNGNGQLEKQSNFNAAVYDSLAISVVSEVDLNNPNITPQKVTQFKNLFLDPLFHDYVSGSILDSSKIINRIDLARNIFK